MGLTVEPDKPARDGGARLESEAADAHRMLDRLGARGCRGVASIRDRLDTYLRDLRNGRSLPTAEEVRWSRS